MLGSKLIDHPSYISNQRDLARLAVAKFVPFIGLLEHTRSLLFTF